MRIKCIFTAFIFSLMAFASMAQESNRYIYFSDALSLANAQNLNLVANEYEHSALLLDKKAAAGLRSPQFGLMANYSIMSQNIGFDFNGLKAPVGGILDKLNINPAFKPLIKDLMSKPWELTLQDNNFGVFGATMVAPIYMGGKINAANNAAKIRIRESENKNQKDKSALYSELVERYFGLALAQQVVNVRNEVLAGMQKHYNDAVALEKNGMIANGEKLYAEMFFEKAKTEKQKSSRDVASINTALENTLNAKGSYQPLTNMFILTTVEPLDYFVNYAMQNSPILKQVDFKKELAEQQVKAKLSELLPTVSAIGAANIVDYQVTDLIPRAFVGVNINYKLFNGTRNIHEYKSAKETVKRVDVIKRKAELDIATLIEKNYNDILSLAEQVESYQKNIEFAEEYYRVKTKAFNEGMASSSDVVDAQLNLAKSKIERLELAYKFDVAFAKMLEVCGLSDSFQRYMVGVGSKAISF